MTALNRPVAAGVPRLRVPAIGLVRRFDHLARQLERPHPKRCVTAGLPSLSPTGMTNRFDTVSSP